MLEKIDIGRVAAAARSRGYQRWELYAEQCFHSQLEVRTVSVKGAFNATHEGRIEDARLFSTGGIALRLWNGSASRLVSTNRFDTATLVAAIEGRSPDRQRELGGPAARPVMGETARRNAEIAAVSSERLKRLGHCARVLVGLDPQNIRIPIFRYEDTLKRFEVVTSLGSHDRGGEETASVVMNWALDQGNRRTVLKAERWGSDIELLVRLLERDNPLEEEMARSVGLTSPWPAPQGPLPVLWSERALAKLLLHFLRGFEGDLVLSNLSFLNELALPLKLGFSIGDLPDTSRLHCDLEGSPRRQLTVFDGTRPRALACNNAVAEQLKVESTGHCRRESLHAAPTVGFWSPVVRPQKASSGLLESLAKGIRVHDLDVTRFDPASGDIRLRLTQARLIHHGELGEWIEPVDWDINLLDLLSSLEVFSQDAVACGLASHKRHQRFVTEITTPEAISPELPVPGTVSPAQYW